MTTLLMAEQVCERLIDALNNLASLPDAENTDLCKIDEALEFITAQAADIERLTEERDEWKAARDACENAYQETMIASLRNLDRAEAAEGSLAAVTKERDIAIGERIARAKVLSRVRNELVNIRDDLEDDGDRVYFGSTNDADSFRDFVSEAEQWEWHDVLRDAQQVDPFETSRKAIARAEAAEAERDALRAALEWMRGRDDVLGSLPEAYRKNIDAALSSGQQGEKA